LFGTYLLYRYCFSLGAGSTPFYRMNTHALSMGLNGIIFINAFVMLVQTSGWKDFLFLLLATLYPGACFFIALDGLRRERRAVGATGGGIFSCAETRILMVAAVLGLVFLPFYYLYAVPHLDNFGRHTSAGHFDRAQMESLVAQVRQQKFSDEKDFNWDVIAGKATLLPATTIDEGIRVANWVWARRTEDQKLDVVIMTVNGGHAVSYGFAYSDKILVPEKDPDSEVLLLDVPGMNETSPEEKIDEHWWEVFDDKD
jgi:hypothetical protein